MHIHELAQKYRQGISKTWDDIRVLKHLYISLGRDKVFDPKYYFGNEGTMKKIYMLAERKRHDKTFGTDTRELICYSLANKFKQLVEDEEFSEYGFQCKVTVPINIGDHVSNIIQLRNHVRVEADLQLDCEYIQTGRKTRNFFIIDHSLSQEEKQREMLKIDQDIHYIQEESDYKDHAIERLTQRIKGKELDERIEILVSDPEINQLSDRIGYIEFYQYYKGIMQQIVSPKEFGHQVYLLHCCKQKDPEKRTEEDYTSCLYVSTSKKSNVYLLSRKDMKYKRVDLATIPTLTESGLQIGLKPKENGAKMLRREVECAIKEQRLGQGR